MRAVLQRVRRGRVTVAGREVGAISRGFVVLLGVGHGDQAAAAEWLADKIAGLRLFEDAQGKMNLSLADVSGEVLVVSQFTLYADTRKGRRPSFTDAADPELAQQLFVVFTNRLREHELMVYEGIFGAHMLVEIENDGPVTILLER
ncbi:MAG: D-aminoacyl-tRNA deacylase [Anaerolineales bacterium]|jgi:D-tyrosyl-tRNA(Tyr) deacylase